MSAAISFNVRVHTETDDIVGVVGSSFELGEWDHERAILLEKQFRDVWAKVVHLKDGEEVEYRFFVGRFLENDNNEKGLELTIVRWETPVNPRCLTVNGPTTLPVEEFGNFNGFSFVANGWLTGQTCLQLRIHSDPILMFKKRYSPQRYSVKCIPIDYRSKQQTSPLEVDEDSRDGPSVCSSTRITVVVLNEKDYNSGPQETYGTVFNNDDYLVFKVQSFHCRYLGFQLEFFVSEPSTPSDSEPKYIGFAQILPVDQQRSLRTRLRLPIMGLQHKPIGEIYVDYLLIKPFTGHKCLMDVSYQCHWRMKGKTLDIGHRGMGVSHKHIEMVQENTLASFSEAADHGADMVEFDVLLTKDHEPLVWHDYTVNIHCKKGCDEEELLEVPIKDLTLTQLHSMKLSHPSSLTESDIKNNSDERPFPTLKQVLQNADERLAFFMEVKYPLAVQSGKLELDQYFDHNLLIDKILEDVFNYAGSRKIVFASFDAETCIMLQLKQNHYPVMFMTCGQCGHWEPYKDFRARNFEVAISFALSEGLMGVGMNLEVMLHDMSLMKKAHEMGLVIFVWGEEANNKEMIRQLRRQGADGIIYDRIDFHRPKDNVQFEMESSADKTLINKLTNVGQSL